MNVRDQFIRRYTALASRILFVLAVIPGSIASFSFGSSVYAQGAGLCSGVSPTSYSSPATPLRISHPEYEAKGWKVMLRTGPSMACEASPIWADDNLRVEQIGTYMGTDQSWSLLSFTQNGSTQRRWAETRFIEPAGGSASCSNASPSTHYNPARRRILSHPEYEAQGWKVMLRTGPSMSCDASPIWADDNLTVLELGSFDGLDQSWSLLKFSDNGTVKTRWAETRFLETPGGRGGCTSASTSVQFYPPRSKTLSHPEYETRGWKVMLRTGPSMDCDSDPIWADDNLQVEELGTFMGPDQSWSQLRFSYQGQTLSRWAETRFLEVAGGTGGCQGATPSNRIDPPRSRRLSHPEYETKGWKVMLRTGPSMDCDAEPIWADDNLMVEERGVYIGPDQSWSLLQFSHNGALMQRWAETRFLEDDDAQTPIKPLPRDVPIVIFDTDMGPDIDDALALAALHAYASQGKAHIAAVTLSRNSTTGARYIDLLNTFYQRPDIPVGIYRGTTDRDNADTSYTREIVNSGKYPYSLDTERLPQGHLLMRDVMRAAPDNSVVIVQVGFSTNTARLLDEYPDLVARKARLLSVMAGDFQMPQGGRGAIAEFNIKIHPGSAGTVFNRWPNDLVVSEFHLGYNLLYPLSSIYNDFNYVANHPIKDSYLNSNYSWHSQNGSSYDMRSWDITSVIAAIQPDLIPRALGPGRVEVNGSHTNFNSGGGNHYVLAEAGQLGSAKRQQLIALMRELVSAAPSRPNRELRVSISENPFQCNDGLRTLAQISGFNTSEPVRVSVNGQVYPVRAASAGIRTINWRCDNGGSTLRIRAEGLTSGLSTDFSVLTAGSAAPRCLPAYKRRNPGQEILEHVVRLQHAVSYSEPLEPFDEGCRAGQRRSFDEGERVRTIGFAGGYLELAGGGWIRASALGVVPKPEEPPPMLAENVSRSAADLLQLIDSQISNSLDDEVVDAKLFVQCYLFARREDVSAEKLDTSSGLKCIESAAIAAFRSDRASQWYTDILDALINELFPAIDQGIDDFLNHPVVNLLGISDIARCAEGMSGVSEPEGHYCIYAAVGVIPVPVSKLPKAIRFLRSGRVPSSLSAAMSRYSDEVARFARFCRVTGTNSFHADTLVATENGLLAIENIEIGSRVLAYNELTGMQAMQPVVDLIQGEGLKSLVDVELETGEVITTTAGHPFYLPTARRWVDAGELKPGQSLLSKGGKHLAIERITSHEQDLRVYNLTVANDHTYYAGKSGVLNHNASRCKFPVWSTKSTNHLRGEFNNGFKGYHTRYLGRDRAGVEIFDKSRVTNKGIYTARVRARKSDGTWVNKSARSTFFPDSWDLTRIQDEVRRAYATARMNGDENLTVIEKSTTGFKILVQVDANDNIIRTHPVL